MRVIIEEIYERNLERVVREQDEDDTEYLINQLTIKRSNDCIWLLIIFSFFPILEYLERNEKD